MNESAVACFSGEDKHGRTWPGCGYRLDVSGGWADAGDYGKYVVNGGIAVWSLQHAYERLLVNGGAEVFGWGDGRAPMPENGNGVSDILDEARWQLEFMMRMQVPEGETVAIARGLAGGAAPKPWRSRRSMAAAWSITRFMNGPGSRCPSFRQRPNPNVC